MSHSACRLPFSSATGNDQLLYFTSSSLLPDETLVIISDESGAPNIYHFDPESGERRMLSANDDGYLHSYVYFDGQPYCGIGKASVSLHQASGTAYYLQGRQIIAADLRGNRRVLAEYPAGQVTAFTHVSADGKRLCVPTTDARALEGYAAEKYDIDERVQRENLSSYLHIYDTVTGDEIACEEVPRAWITHVQFSPINSDLILYNHEWPADCGIRRMWLWDGKEHRCLRPEGEGRHHGDWTCHEMWQADGQAIIYHGAYQNGPGYLGRVAVENFSIKEIPFPADYSSYGHFTISVNGLLVSDGYYHDADAAENEGSAWISIQQVDWQNGEINWIPLCRHNSSWNCQDSHPHPIFNCAGNAVYYTSDCGGKRAVYRVKLG